MARPTFLRLFLVPSLAIALFFAAFSAVAAEKTDAGRWYRGNTHAHTFWSDGDEFPEMVAEWYKTHGYDFLAISDHNILMEGEKWLPIGSDKLPVGSKKRFVLPETLKKCQERFGEDWLEICAGDDERKVKLKTLDEVRAKIADPGKFILIQNEEISDKFQDHAVHINAINLTEMIPSQQGAGVADTIANDLAAVDEQAKRLNRTIIAHVNHPNWADYDISAEDLAAVPAARFFEVCNGIPSVNNGGDSIHPSTDLLWDVANTIRIAKMKLPPLMCVAGDDAHRYQSFLPNLPNPGRAWIMVRAKQLDTQSLLEAIDRGDFYASTGITLKDISFDAKKRTMTVEVKPEPGVNYTIEFLGTLAGANPTYETIPSTAINKITKTPKRDGRKYSPEIGKVLSSVKGVSASYTLTGKELYVRAVVRSDKPANVYISKNQTAWCQPVWNNQSNSPLKKGTGSEPSRVNAAENGGCEVPDPLFQRPAK